MLSGLDPCKCLAGAFMPKTVSTGSEDGDDGNNGK